MPNLENRTHKERTLSGVVWNFLSVFGQTILTLGTGVILARLLPPEDFGLLAIAMVFVGLADLVSSVGMGPSVVQRKELTEKHIRVATSLSIIAGISLFAILISIAKSISYFFNDARLFEIIPILAGGLAFSAFSAVSRGLLVRKMDFRSLFLVDFSSYFVGYAGVAVTLALLDYGVWSLVIGSSTSLVLQFVLLVYISPPGIPCIPERKETKELLGFGAGFTLNSIINYFAANIDYILIGKYQSSLMLGLYTRAYQLATMPHLKIAATLSSSLFPSYAEIQDDRKKIGRAYLMTITGTSLITIPIYVGFFLCGEAVIAGMYGDKWSAAVPVFKTLALAGLLKGLCNLAGGVAKATGNINGEIKRQFIYLIVLCLGCVLAVPYGIEAVAWAVVLGSLCLYLSMADLACKIGECKKIEFLKAHMPGVYLSLIIGISEIGYMEFQKEWLILTQFQSLVIIIIISSITGALGLLYLPEKLIGKIPGWVLKNYSKKIPPKILIFIPKRHKQIF